jgi:hypothetical protein
VGSGECAIVIWLFTVWGRLLLLRQQHCNSVWAWLLLLMHSICHKLCNDTFDVHRAVHCNIISIVKPTRCTSVSNLCYFGMTLYTFWTVFPSITRSSRLYIQQQAFVRQILLYVQSGTPDDSSICLVAVCTVLNSWWQQYLFGCCMYSLELLMMLLSVC